MEKYLWIFKNLRNYLNFKYGLNQWNDLIRGLF